MSIEARLQGRLANFALNAQFSLPAHGVTGLFGPSGCGKTSVLRCLAGLTKLQHGYLRVGDMVWQDKTRFLRPHQRAIGYVFQDAALFPHLSVLQNLRYGLQRAGTAAPGVSLNEVVDVLGLGGMLSRAPKNLSGGERQRVAIGRAVLAQPRLLLMDEPLAGLDHAARREILPYLETLCRSLSMPMIYVSHEFGEIERLADRLILMGDGQVLACGPLGALLADLSLPVARQPDAAMVLDAIIVAVDAAYDLTSCRAGAVEFFVPGNLGPPGARRRLRIRASDVSLAKTRPQDSSMLNILPARIVSADAVSPAQMLVLLRLGEMALLSSITRKSWETLALAPGDEIFAQVKGMALAGPLP